MHVDPTERLTTLDEYGSRRFVIPAEVQGPYRTWRNRVFAVLIFVFLALPWIKINHVQALLFDIPGRRFAVFGKLFFAHDAPILFLLLTVGVMALAFTTAVWGRIWCGWACPQTVFIDAVYRRIEIWIEGRYIERRRLRTQGWTFRRLYKGVLKWTLYFLVSAALAHTLFALFAGVDRLSEMVRSNPEENWGYFLIIYIVTGILCFNFGWFREQFCTIMCPYGRFQSVLMDEQSVAVLYDEKRGDCIECNRCVEVCPAKIDIRKGLQMECIACTACMDACDVIMRKVNKPEKLIRYSSVSGAKAKVLRPRPLLYAAVGLTCFVLLTLKFINHEPFDLLVLRAKDTPYQILQEGQILNHFKLHIFNQSSAVQEFAVAPTAALEAQGVKLVQSEGVHTVKPGTDLEQHVFLTFPKSLLDSQGEAHLELEIREKGGATDLRKVTVVGPQSTP